MAAPILMTKLYIPPSQPDLVTRPHLVKQLNESLHRMPGLILISAPAGSGKTTLVSSWLHQQAEDGGLKANSEILHPSALLPPPFKIAWLSLDEADNDPTRFWTYFITALQQIDPELGLMAQSLLQSPQPPPVEALMTTLINDIATTSNPIIFVLDDYHLIEAKSIHQALTFLLDHLPAHLHLVIATRVDLPLPLARLRARGQLTELRSADLRFTSAEIAALLNRSLGLSLPDADLAVLEERTEGWAAGLQLAALSMRGQQDIPAFIEAFTGSHRYIVDYLGEEVLSRQPETVQTFLLETAILEQFSGPLGDAVTGRADSQAMIEHLERANLFIMSLDNQGEWYRYHHLFAELLRQRLKRLQPERVPKLHQRASAWYARQGMLPQAVEHALAAGDFERAVPLIEQMTLPLLTRGEVTTLVGWLEALPETTIRTRPRLILAQAWVMEVTNRWDRLEALLPEVEHALLTRQQDHSEAESQELQGELATLQTLVAVKQGRPGRAVELSEQALAQLPQTHHQTRGLLMLNLGVAYERLGNLAQAEQMLAEAISISQDAAGHLITTLHALNSLAVLHEEQGRLRQAAEVHRQALRLATPTARRGGGPGQPLPIAGRAYLGLAELHREWNDLETAQEYALAGIKLGRQSQELGVVQIGQIILARLRQAQGEPAGALEAIQQAEQVSKPVARRGAWVAAVQARLWLAQGNRAAAAHWAQTCGLPLAEAFNFSQFPGEYATLVRVYLAQERIEAALELLGRMLTAAEAAGRMGRVIEIMTLQALGLSASGRPEPALASLARALTLAEPEDYVRLFVDEGTPMARLLHLARDRVSPLLQAYIGKLLAASGYEVNDEGGTTTLSPAFAVHPPALVERLTEREREVLRLIAAGLSNQEIAERLVITLGTTKRHTVNIYGKLGVSSRTQAVVKARDLGLLE